MLTLKFCNAMTNCKKINLHVAAKTCSLLHEHVHYCPFSHLNFAGLVIAFHSGDVKWNIRTPCKRKSKATKNISYSKTSIVVPFGELYQGNAFVSSVSHVIIGAMSPPIPISTGELDFAIKIFLP